MKRYYFLLVIISEFIFLNTVSAQAGEWVWLHGSQNPFSAGSFGTKGVSSPSNEPPALYETCEWTDLQGRFWFYGGLDNADNDHTDLWMYYPAGNEWTWINGTNTVNDPGNYGAQGVPSASNYPPSKSWGVASWVDLNGNFWMFGGDKSVGGAFSDLWQYNVATGEWTWMKGPDITNQGGTYGTRGVPNVANNPGCRWECPTAWTDKAGDLWLFGGTYSAFNDLWRYNIATNTWTWMKGSQLTGQPAVYGVQGVEDSLNTPGGRGAHARWTDKCGNLWLFGGADASLHYYNDLWRFNVTSNNWTWMNGDTIADTKGFYGTRCTMASSNKPGSRSETRATWTDTIGNLWMFGGGFGGNDSAVWNDLWMYCVSGNQWVWESGDSSQNPVGNWGSIGVASATNKPNGRAGAVAWTDHNGHLYFFGGTTKNFVTPYNDLWEFTIDTGCGSNCSSLSACLVPPKALFLSSDTDICQFDCINFTDLSSNATSWSWSFSGALPSSSTDQNPHNICYLSTGIYDVTLAVSNDFGNDTMNVSSFIIVSTTPKTPVITKSNDTLFCSTDTGYISYQWFADTTLIQGATDSILVISQSGNYNVQVSNRTGCSVAVGINIILGLNRLTSGNNHFTIYPNPAGDQIIISGEQKPIDGVLIIYNVLGEKMIEQQIQHRDQSYINVKDLSAGIYFVEMTGDSIRWVSKFVKE